MMNRRRAIALMGSGATLALPTMGAAAAPAVRFDHGVASGDPSPDGAILWTRATPAEGQGAMSR
ncbi:PhoD-like phosphatase N-terminal domain-containing protein [Sphingomonas sp. I4]